MFLRGIRSIDAGGKTQTHPHPSSLVEGLATKPKGLSLRHAFLSSARRPRAREAIGNEGEEREEEGREFFFERKGKLVEV